MLRSLLLAGAAILVLDVPATAQGSATPQPAATPAGQSANPLLGAWTTPDGVPPYDLIRAEHYEPAFDAAIEEARREMRAITAQRAAPTFANTIEAMERAGSLLSRTSMTFFNVASADATPAIQKVQAAVVPKLTRFRSETMLDPALFQRVDAVWKQRERLNLNPEQRRLLERTHLGFVRAGAALPAEGRQRLAAIDARLAELGVKFGQNLLADQKQGDVRLTEAEVAGLSDAQKAAAAQKAKARGFDGFVVTATRPDVEPFLSAATNRAAREKVWRAFVSRGDNGDAEDNNAHAAEMLRLRAERAKLLGFATHAHYVLDDSMAKTPEAAMGLLRQVYDPALVRARAEEADLLKLARADGLTAIEPWDWRFYAQRVKQARFDLDDAEVKPYLELDRMIAAAFDTANRLWGLTFVERRDVPVYHPDVRVWEVREADGRRVGLFYGDWFARDTKSPGAWMNSLRVQSRLDGEVLPIVVNNCNYVKPAPGQPALISFDDAETLFHEFGHALHGLLSNATYDSLAGTAVSRDFVEFPAQLMEHFINDPAVLKRHAVNAQGQPMPDALIAKLQKARTFNQGFLTVQQLSSALVDKELHLMGQPAADFDLRRAETAILAKYQVPASIGMRHRSAHFSHIFNGGYSSAYYAYTWAEAMDADGFDAFKETGDIFNRAVAQRLRKEVLERGNTRDAAASYIAFRGRMPNADALLRNRGLLGPQTVASR